MKYTVYKTTNNINGKMYIGKHKTKNLDDGYMGSGKLLKRAIKKYGVENFKKEILYVFQSEKEMNSKESELVNEEFINRKDTYNLCHGGYGGFGYINKNGLRFNAYTFTSLDIEKAVSRRRELWLDEKWATKQRSVQSAAKLGNTNWVGKKHTEETKKKMSISQKGKHDGKKNSQYDTRWVIKNGLNKKVKKEMLNEWLTKGWRRGRK